MDSGTAVTQIAPRATHAFIPGVHVARAVAVLLVLAAHTVGLWTKQENFVYAPWQACLGLVIEPLRIDHQAGGHMGPLVFFLVSGYIVSQAAEGDSRSGFALKPAARLLSLIETPIRRAVRHRIEGVPRRTAEVGSAPAVSLTPVV